MTRDYKQSKIYRRVSTAGLTSAADVQRHEPAMRSLWTVHVQGTLRREIPNNITIDDYAAYTQQQCYYCGTAPNNPTKFGNASILYHGLDRVDNTRPYEVGNLVTCCKQCNAMKSKLTDLEFLEHVVKIANYVLKPGNTSEIPTNRPPMPANYPIYHVPVA